MALVKYNNNSISDITTTALATGSLVPIKTLTASSSATLSFVHGTDGVVLDSTYPIYKFEFINIHPASNAVAFTVGFRDGGTNYDAVKTSTAFFTEHGENGSGGALGYQSSRDIAQGTGFQDLMDNIGNDNDQNLSGYLNLFNPSSTTFVKHWLSKTVTNAANTYIQTFNTAGYNNVTAAIDGVQFKMSSGNIDSGKIKLYGIKDS